MCKGRRLDITIFKMAEQIKDKKRTYDQSLDFVELSVQQLGNSFKRKADFYNYFGTMLQVSIATRQLVHPSF